MQPNTSAEGDNTINTKKGFMISLPSKKDKNGGNETASGIVMAKTVNENAGTNANQQTGKPANDNRSGSDKRHKFDRNRKRGGENGSAPQNQHNKPSGENARENENRNGKNAKNGNQRRDRNFGKPNKNNQQHDGQNNQQNNQQNNRRNDAKPVQNSSPQAQDRNHNHHEHHNQKNNNRRNDRHDRRERDRKRRGQEFTGLSPLSKDMQSFAGISGSDIAKMSEEKAPVKELSLEEKYKNAIPLADQIASEEAKRHAKPKAMKVTKIDRTQTANALHSQAVANAEEGAVHEVDFGKNYEVVGIRFREAGKIYYFDPDGREVPYGTPVIVETARGAEYGYTAISNRLVPPSGIIPPLKKIKRIATTHDTEKYIANKELEKEAAEIFKQKVSALGLEMNLVFVEYTFDNSKLLFYFTAESRIDFRELVKELASVFRTRIELRQIGVRDEAKMLGGLGACGRSVCCNSFLGDFAQVSIKMAKDQGLSLNSAKISGACGKLMCCLRYEDKVYEEEMARTPKVGSVVETDEGRGVVTEAHALKGVVKVTLESSPDAPPKAFDREDVTVVGFNKAAIKEENVDLKELKALEDS